MSVEMATPAAVATPTRLEALGTAVLAAIPAGLTAVPNHCGELTYEVAADQLLSAALTLRDTPALKFEMCMDVCGIDYLQHGVAEWTTQGATSSGFSRGVAQSALRDSEVNPGRRFAVVYHLLSISLNQRVRLRVFCAEDRKSVV